MRAASCRPRPAPSTDACCPRTRGQLLLSSSEAHREAPHHRDMTTTANPPGMVRPPSGERSSSLGRTAMARARSAARRAVTADVLSTPGVASGAIAVALYLAYGGLANLSSLGEEISAVGI